MDEELPYADDIQYEEELPDKPEQTAPATLKERIGNRIYLLEDSRKRKITGPEGNGQDEDEDAGDADADLTYRSNALLLQGPPISQLSTARVFAYATHFDAHPIGLEWVDDQTCVLVFTSHKHALQGLDALRRQSHSKDSTNIMQTENEEEIVFVGPPLPLALYPIEERINSALGTHKSDILKGTIIIRWARAHDVKQPGARSKSEFYKKHGETAGKDGLAQILPLKRRRRNEDDSWDARRKLDADLDTFFEGRSEELPAGVSVHVGEKRRRIEHEEMRRRLDNELDSFLAQGSEPETLDKRGPEILASSGGRSLMERTRRALPQRGRERRHNARELNNEGESGRWLHNAEIRQSWPRFDYDEKVCGMRAWREDRNEERRPAGRTGKPRKTQEDLDRELREFLDK